MISTARRAVLLADTVLRRVPGESTVWLMNRPEGGWGSFGLEFPSVAAVEAAYAVTVFPWTVDKHGDCAPVRRWRQ